MRPFDFPMERVFDAWLDRVKAGKFLFATPNGNHGAYSVRCSRWRRFQLHRPPQWQDIKHVGTYLEIDRSRLVFTLGVPQYSSQFTLVRIDLTPIDAGCELNLNHEGVLPEYVDRTREGWGKILDGLASYLAKEPE